MKVNIMISVDLEVAQWLKANKPISTKVNEILKREISLIEERGE